MYWDCVRSFIWGILYIFVTFYFSERGKAGLRSLSIYTYIIYTYIYYIEIDHETYNGFGVAAVLWAIWDP